MNMFESFLASIPKNRSEMVNDLEIPDVKVEPYIWRPPEDILTMRSDSLTSASIEEELQTFSSDCSLSRAMTDSEIDYGRYKRFKNRSYSDPWDHLKATLDEFPPEYLDSLRSFQTVSSDVTEDSTISERIHLHDEELRLKMERYFDECQVFTPDDPGLLSLEEALSNLDLKSLESDIANSSL